MPNYCNISRDFTDEGRQPPLLLPERISESLQMLKRILKRKFSHCLLKPTDIEPIRPQTRVVGAFNPGVATLGDEVIMLVRVAEQPTETREGLLPSPRIDTDQQLVIDWLEQSQTDLSDPRLYQNKSDGSLRLRFISHLKIVRIKDGRNIDNLEGKTILPQGEYEEYGIEDPRITQIGQTYYITYVAVSRYGTTTCLMSTTDFEQFQRHGVIFYPGNKDVVLFPEKILDSYVAIHRPMPSMKFSAMQMWLARSNDLVHWGLYEQMLASESSAYRDRIGAGTPPIKTTQGWLTLYHGSDKTPQQDGAGTYCAGALLLDLQNPKRIVGHSRQPIMVPTEPFEKSGFVDNVVFPTAIIQRNGHYLIYYGAADQCVGVTAFDKQELLDTLVGH